MTKGKLFYSIMMVLTVLVISAAPSPSTAATSAAKPIELTFANPLPESAWGTVYGLKPWIENVHKATNNRVKISLYNNQTLVKQDDQVSAVRNGVADMAWMAWTRKTDLIPYNVIPSLPALGYKSDLHSAVVAQQAYEKFPSLQKEISFVKSLFLIGGTPMVLATTKKQVKSPDDIKGLKIRVAGGFGAPFFQAHGAVPVSIGVGDLYMSLQQGVIDGALINAEIAVSFRLYEILKYYVDIPFVVGPAGMIMNNDRLNSLPADIRQQIMSVSGMEGTKFVGDRFYTSREEAKQVAEKAGRTFNVYYPTKEESAKWLKPANELSEDYIKDLQAKGKTEARAIYDGVLKLKADYK
jgi:TRAP-type C4-dicarboxylate transport system substrate-binding protein